ncbi:autophagy-related protein 16-like [Rhinatrema bivittatum]|uniref:autophagy-related protein 16-like n=1 Tax=Rhinatrema bivittatum TaxID=194408 RepID=UPI00112965AE|nr:autophagy-related protein 16-like [Rhinatrema bivittatum]
MERTWKLHIKVELGRRDRSEKDGYQRLLDTHAKLVDRLDLQKFLAEKLQLEINKTEFSASPPQERMRLDTAVLQIQHQLELAELHKAWKELSQTVLDLNKTLQLKETEIQDYQARVSRSSQETLCLMKRCLEQESALEKLEQSHQLLGNEHDALQLTFTALEERLHRIESENQKLVTRWMEEKALEADRLNRCNEQEERSRRIIAKLKHKLELLRRKSSDIISPV